MITHESFKTQPMQCIPLNRMNMLREARVEGDIVTMTRKIEVNVIETIEQELIDAILKAAYEAGVTDLYLIDKEFIVSAIKHEKERRGI